MRTRPRRSSGSGSCSDLSTCIPSTPSVPRSVCTADLFANHVLVKGSTADLTDDLRRHLISHKSHAFGFTGLARTIDLAGPNGPASLQTERPDLEALMLYFDLAKAAR